MLDVLVFMSTALGLLVVTLIWAAILFVLVAGTIVLLSNDNEEDE